MHLRLLATLIAASVVWWAQGQTQESWNSVQTAACTSVPLRERCKFTWYYDSKLAINGTCEPGKIKPVNPAQSAVAACMPNARLPPPPPAKKYFDTTGLSWEEILPPCFNLQAGATCKVTPTAHSTFVYVHGYLNGTCTPGYYGSMSIVGCLPTGASLWSSYGSSRTTKATNSFCVDTCASLGLVSGGQPKPFAFTFNYEQFVKTGELFE